MSQHLDSIELYHILKNQPVKCASDLGVKWLKLLLGASPGAGGATLLEAEYEGYPIVIKAFPISCPYKYINGRRRNNTNIRDYGNFEIGTGLMLTEMFILNSLTQNIVTCYNYSICEFSYPTEMSICRNIAIDRQSDYPIVNNNKHPLHHYYNSYFSPNVNNTIVTPLLDDMMRFFVVEKCEGDLQGFIERNSDDYHELMINLNRIIPMILHTLLLFDIVLQGYSHYDLGLRNILYVIDPHGSDYTYNRYIFPDLTAIDIPSSTIIPKIWDYAFVRYGRANEFKSYYDYLGDTLAPDYSNVEGRDNDVYILLQDLDKFLRINHITNSIYNTLDLNSIRECRNNTDAIDEYFRQNPINLDYADESHNIIHTFPSDMGIY